MTADFHEHLWEYDPTNDTLITHERVAGADDVMACGRRPEWLPADSIEIDDTWFGDHDREPEAIRLCEPCGTKADRERDCDR